MDFLFAERKPLSHSSPTISVVCFFYNVNLCPLIRCILFKKHLMTFSLYSVILPNSLFLPLSLSPLIIFLLLSLLISQYLLIYLILCKLLMLCLCLAQTACSMRYLYESIFLLALFKFAFICRYFVPHVEQNS